MHELESISIKSCDIDVPFEFQDQLKYISISKSKMFYDPGVHTQVKCISPIDIDIKETLEFPDVIESICT